jgi:flavin-dependent dehydrogenase
MLRTLGRSVVVIEKAPHPRFHIGESLLPSTMGLLRRIGFMPTMEQAGFVPKWGSTFMLGDGRLSNTFYFAQSLSSNAPGAYQVTRSRFDHLLLEHSRRLGAEVREGHTVRDVAFGDDEVAVSVQAPGGTGVYTLRGRYFADATGRETFLASRLKLKRMDARLRKVALFAHFAGARRDEGRDAGNTISVVIRGGWIWFIPLEDGVTSVGVVIDGDRIKASATPVERFFHDTLDRVPELRSRLAGARRLTEVHVTSDFSYTSRALHGRRHLVIGDAGFFLDPVFSSGVHLAISAGVLGAEALDQQLGASPGSASAPAGRSGRGAFRRYERQVRRSQGLYVRFIRGWYSPGFLELFLAPTRKFQMVEAITSVLAGGGSDLRVAVRLWLFFMLVRLNRLVPLVPVINQAELP